MLIDSNTLARVRDRARALLPGLIGSVHCRSTLTLDPETSSARVTAMVISVEVALDVGCEVADEITLPACSHAGYMHDVTDMLVYLEIEIAALQARRAREVADDISVDMRPTRPMRFEPRAPMTGGNDDA